MKQFLWRPPLPSGFVAGDRLGRYELLNIIGGGGFAAVWRARTVGPGGFERSVAIKVIRRGRASQKRFQDMLLDEARLVARIQHSNVTQIWEVGEDPRSLYFAMELVEGESLDELRYRAEAAGKTLPIRAVFRVLADICGGLHVAHELTQDGRPLGLVHRDVSPQNILVSHHGIAKLIDFGIAKAKERLAADTTTGYIKGKISYMAPEQARAEEIDRRADVWAIGAVAFDILEGKPPFDGETDLGRLATLVGPTPAPAMSDRVPAPLRAVVERTLQKDPAGRYPTALALKEALEEALIESEMETTSDECAALFRPYFQPIATGPSGLSEEAEGTAQAGPQSVERPVSSTIEARSPSETIQLPLHTRRTWPLLVGAAVVGLPVAFWAMSRSAPISGPAEAPSAATAAAAPTTATATTTSATGAAAPEKTASPSASGVPTASAVPSAVPSATASAVAPAVSATAPRPAPTSSAVPSVQGKVKVPAISPTGARPPAQPKSSLTDDDAIE